MADEPNKWMTAQEVMAYLGIARSTLSLYEKQGRLKVFQQDAPKRILFLRSQVEELKRPKPKP